jgi:hypothetical protein
VVAKRLAELLKSQRLGKNRVVAKRRMRVQRKVAGVDGDVCINRRLDDAVDSAVNAADASAPRNPVVDYQQICLGLRRDFHGAQACIDRNGGAADFAMRPRQLQSVV